MNAVEPFGSLEKARFLIIGHDPRLHRSPTEAKYAFFLDTLWRFSEPPAPKAETRKYGLARAVVEYVQSLAGAPVELDDLYVTNLCNAFLPPKAGRGVVYIPEWLALDGIAELREAATFGHFDVILPMSQQVFYYLARFGFLEENNERLRHFVSAAWPRESGIAEQVYRPHAGGAFLEVCGQVFHHAEDTPVIPILHVKNYPLRGNFRRYEEAMALAARNVQACLNSSGWGKG